MRVFPNCGSVYFKGKIKGMGGEPVNGRIVRLRFFDQVVFRTSGPTPYFQESPGEWIFDPGLTENMKHTQITFLIDIVASENNPTPWSDTVTIPFSGCDAAGQFENIVFEYAR
jgi:hypothetical protein